MKHTDQPPNEPKPRVAYQTPKLEVHAWVAVTGINLSISGNLLPELPEVKE